MTFKNGRIGNVVDEKGALLGGSSSTASMGVIMDNVDFHDVIQRATASTTSACTRSSPGVMIRNSTFRACATMDLMITRGFWWSQPAYGGVTLENNVFAHSTTAASRAATTTGCSSTARWASSTNARIVNNTFENSVGGFTNAEIGSASGVWANNIGGGGTACRASPTGGNVGKKCAASDVAVNPSGSCAPPTCAAGADDAGRLDQPGAYDFRSRPVGRDQRREPERRAGARPARLAGATAARTPARYEHGAQPDATVIRRPVRPGSTPGAGWRLRSRAACARG